MKCAECRILIEEYFDGELDAPIASRVRHHLDGCTSCSSVLKSLNAEQSVYANYKSDIEISPELWAGIHQRLETERQARQPFGSWLQNVFSLPPVSGPVAVGLVVLAVVLTVVVMHYVSSPRENVSKRGVAEGTPQSTPVERDQVAVLAPRKSEDQLPDKNKVSKPSASNATASDRRSPSLTTGDVHKTKDPRRLVREAEQKYLAAIAMLSRSVDRKKSRLDPATTAELEQALSSIDRTIAATRKVVRQHPDDPVAAQYMLTAYAKKVDVLRELVNY